MASPTGCVQRVPINDLLSQAIRAHDVQARLPFDPCVDVAGLRQKTGLHPLVQLNTFQQPNCWDACQDLVLRPAHIIMPAA